MNPYFALNWWPCLPPSVNRPYHHPDNYSRSYPSLSPGFPRDIKASMRLMCFWESQLTGHCQHLTSLFLVEFMLVLVPLTVEMVWLCFIRAFWTHIINHTYIYIYICITAYLNHYMSWYISVHQCIPLYIPLVISHSSFSPWSPRRTSFWEYPPQLHSRGQTRRGPGGCSVAEDPWRFDT